MSEALASRRLRVPVSSLLRKLFSRERFRADLDVAVGEQGLYERGERGGLKIDLWMESSPDGIRVKGRMWGSIGMECTRCLREYRQKLEIDVDEFYRRPGLGAAAGEGRRLPRDVELPEEDDYLIEENTIDLNVMVNDAVMLSVPIKRLCSQECRGICPYCGKELNEGPCGCRREDTDPRLEILRTLLEEE